MTTFAHTETGKALDPHQNDIEAKYRARFNPALIANWSIVQVPDGTLHGATDNGDGTYTNPVKPPPPTVYKTLTKTEFQKYCHDRLTMARFGKIMRDARKPAASDAVAAVMEYYDSASTVEKAEAANMVAVLVADLIATQQEADNVINNWPVV